MDIIESPFAGKAVSSKNIFAIIFLFLYYKAVCGEVFKFTFSKSLSLEVAKRVKTKRFM